MGGQIGTSQAPASGKCTAAASPLPIQPFGSNRDGPPRGARPMTRSVISRASASYGAWSAATGPAPATPLCTSRTAFRWLNSSKSPPPVIGAHPRRPDFRQKGKRCCAGERCNRSRGLRPTTSRAAPGPPESCPCRSSTAPEGAVLRSPRRTASATSATGRMGSTGPKISSRISRVSSPGPTTRTGATLPGARRHRPDHPRAPAASASATIASMRAPPCKTVV